MGNLTDEQKLGLRESSTDITCDKDLLAHVTVEAHDQVSHAMSAFYACSNGHCVGLNCAPPPTLWREGV